MGYANERECELVGLDPKSVERISNRLDKVMRDAKALGISLFCGGVSPTLRYNDNDQSRRLLIVGYCTFNNQDGGDGGCCEDSEGVLRGE